MRGIRLPVAFFLLITAAVLAALGPVALVLGRGANDAVNAQLTEDFAAATRVFDDRQTMSADMMSMHAEGLANAPGLAEAIVAGDRVRAMQVASAAVPVADEMPVVVVGTTSWTTTPMPPDSQLWATRQGQTAISMVPSPDAVYRVAMAPVMFQDEWIGAAGVASMFDVTVAGTLAGLTRSEVIIINSTGDVVAFTADTTFVQAARDSALAWTIPGELRKFRPPTGPEYLVQAHALGGAGHILFARNVDRALSIVPTLRRTIILATLGALAFALGLGAFVSLGLSRPVQSLAHAADRLALEDFAAPVPRSRVREIDRVAHAFSSMRTSLQSRLWELEQANTKLEERQDRLSALQAEFIQRERLAASGRMVAELAHEVRNPVANVRNCLEVLRRRLEGDPTGVEFADLAIDELLRMHELAERMLDLNRPHDDSIATCDVKAVAQQVVSLMRAGSEKQSLPNITLHAPDALTAAVSPDALKQVLINIVQNAREVVTRQDSIVISARRGKDGIEVSVEDTGPGIDRSIVDSVFDPFVTTKTAANGVGLGLFVAAGVLRRFGATITASNRPDQSGACFDLVLPMAESPGQGD